MDRHSASSMSEVEDMVTVSLSEVLASRDGFLEEKEFWALCRECCLTLEYVYDCHDLFQSLCISPETVAFDPEGNVCFLDLDMEPEPLYVAPELEECASSFKSHLFSLGMTLLFATEYNSESDDPKAQLSDSLTDLLSVLTSEEVDLRPDLDSVIDICDKALDGELSQIICLNIVGLKGAESPEVLEQKSNSSLQQVTDELTAYLESQTGLVPSSNGDGSIAKHQGDTIHEGSSNARKGISSRDHNDNCLAKRNLVNSLPLPSSIRDIIKEASPDEDDMLECQDDTNPTPPRRNRKRQGIMLDDLLQSINRFLGEDELWALCRECVACLQKKRKHLPAYISPETVMICEFGNIAFKAIPEDKPLEVVYMAAELQQKGILSEKTCLYGLGITLRKAAGAKLNSSHLSITDGEALEILINSFLQANPDRRPNLDTAYEMCEEYEKVNEGSSREKCIQLYREACETVLSGKESNADAKNNSNDQRIVKESINSLDSSEQDQIQFSSDNTHSIDQGDTTEAEEGIEDIPSDLIEDETMVSAASAFKPLSNSADKKMMLPSSSAFKALPKKDVPDAKKERVPSAFSSPATHFKPIVIQDSMSQIGSAGQNTKSDGDVVSKLRDLKHNLLKKRGSSDASPRAGAQTNSQDTISHNTGVNNKSDTSNSSDLGNYIKQLKNQGQMPDTDTLASAIAKYLQQEMSNSSQNQKSNQNGNMTASNQITSNRNLYSQHHSPSVSYNEKNIMVSASSFASSVPTHFHNTAPQRTFPQPQFPTSKAHPVIQGHTEHQSGAISHAQPFRFPSSHATGNTHTMQYNVPISSVATHGIPPVQFTLVQDPVTGVMQMVPISYMQVPHQHLGHMPNNNQHMYGSNTLTSSSSTSSNLGAQLYDRTNLPPNSQPAFATHYGEVKSHLPPPPSVLDAASEYRHAQAADSYTMKSLNREEQTAYEQDPKRDVVNHRGSSHRDADNHSVSSSPSPSKDSGICLTQQSYNKDILMDRLLSSGHSNRQKNLSKVLGIIREEFAEDGIFDSGVEDLAIAEYVLSLAALKWDTFACAVREKYSHLIWTQEVLMILHDIITDSRSLSSKSSQSVPNEQPRTYGHTHPDSTAVKVPSSIQKNEWQTSEHSIPQMQQANMNNYKEHLPLENQSVNRQEIPPTNQGYGRPRSELARTMISSASDSTDSEITDKRRRYNKKRHSMDKVKSSSLHNVAQQGNIESKAYHPFVNNDNNNNKNDKTYSPAMLVNNSPVDTSVNMRNNPSVFPSSYYSTTSRKPPEMNPNENIIYHRSSTNIPQKSPDNTSASISHNTLNQANPKSSPNMYKQNKLGKIHGQQFSLLPSKNPHNTSSPQSLQRNSQSSSPKRENSRSPVSKVQPKYMIPYNRPIMQSSSSSIYHRHDAQSMPSNGPLTGDHSIHGNQIPDSHSNNSNQNRQDKISKTKSSSASQSMNSKYVYDDDDDDCENGSDVDFNSSAEMRRLAAKKPELYDRRTPNLATPVDRNMAMKSGTPQFLNNSHDSIMAGSQFMGKHRSDDNQSHNYNTLPGNTSSNTLPERQMSKRSEHPYTRSMSAVYHLETGVQVSDAKKEFSHHRRGSDGSADLPAVNCVLLPYVKKGQVVYHSAMIQLSLTPEVDHFIHSIDEENRVEIESKLASLSQEINMQWKQRRKTQRFFKKLSEQNSKSSKGDQNVSDQMLKDMADMTRKLAFLNLCRTHLQMLLAELSGLEVCFLHSLSVCDGQTHLSLEPMMENKYLQFRTFKTKEAGTMSVLQAGTPKGLLSYLYTSSALSDGYIHQFLLCFRYILTADQMFAFIVDKCKSAQRSLAKDINILRIKYRSFDLLQFWIEGYFSIDFGPNIQLTKKLGDFIQEQISANTPGAQELYSLYAACRLHENTELMLMTEMEEDDENDNTYFMHIANPKQWESFRSLLKRSKSDKSLNSSGGISRQKSSDSKATSVSTGPRSTSQFSLSDFEVHALAEQLTLMEQDLFRKCHPVHFLNSQFNGVGVALSMSGLRTPSMSRKMEPTDAKRGLFIGDPIIEYKVVRMISHSQELAHWVSAEILSCGSGKFQAGVIQKFISVAHMCQEVRNFATALSILEGLDNLVIKQLPVWKNISSKCMTYMEGLTEAKMKLKSEAMWLTNSKDFHIYPTVPCALFATLHLQQMEIGGLTLANGMYKWDKMRSISEMVDQLRIFRDHEYGFNADPDLQRMLQRRLNEFSDQDLHAVASTHENNFRRHSSSSSISGTLKKFREIIQPRKK